MTFYISHLFFSGSTSAPCSSLWQLTGRQAGDAPQIHPGAKGRFPTLPEGSLVTPAGWWDLKKKLCWSCLELRWPTTCCERHIAHSVGLSSTLPLRAEGGKWEWNCWTLSQRGPLWPLAPALTLESRGELLTLLKSNLKYLNRLLFY